MSENKAGTQSQGAQNNGGGRHGASPESETVWRGTTVVASASTPPGPQGVPANDAAETELG